MFRIKKYIFKVKNWIKNNRFEALFLLTTLLIGAFFRLYKIDEYMTFLGDEGRDAIIVRRLLVNFDPILIGPGTSIGNMYLGPLYYYLMAPALLLANFSPVGPAVMIALLGIFTIFLVWYITREWFGKLAGFIAALFYAISPIVITYSRSSWNPNIMPFFSLVCIYSIWKIWSPLKKYSDKLKKKFTRLPWFIILGISYAFVLQSHYLGLLLAPVIMVFWLITFIKLRKQRDELRNFLSASFVGLIVFLFLMSPLVIFDARHNWQNFSAIEKFFMERQTTISARPWTALPKIWPIFTKSIERLVASTLDTTGKWVSILLVLGFLMELFNFLIKGFKDKIIAPYFLLFVWLGFALLGLGVYKQEIYDHYYGFFFTAPFILLGGVTHQLLEYSRNKGKVFYITTILIIVLTDIMIIRVNLINNPLKYPPNRQMQRAINVAEKISEESKGEKFNLAVLALRNYEDGYQYFLEKWGKPVYDIDPLNYEKTLANQLFVVCELPPFLCDPIHNPKAEVANFGWSKIEGQWRVSGVILYKLIHTK